MSFNIDQYIGNKDYGLFLTSRHPLDSYPDVFCCGEWPAPKAITWLSESSDIEIDKGSCCLYKLNSNADSVNLIYVGRMYKYTSVKDFQTEKYRCWYNEFLDAISIQNINGLLPVKIEVYNTLGQKVIDEHLITGQETRNNINISHLPHGLYIARLSSLKNNSLNYTFKIIKR